MKKTPLIFLTFAMICVTTVAQDNDTIINWLTFEQSINKFEQRARPIFIFLYNNSCDSCTIMEESVFTDGSLALYINQTTYPIRLNIYGTDTITFFDGTVFTGQGGNELHGLIKFLFGNTVPQPAILMFNRQGEGALYEGYHSLHKLYSLLIYYWEDVVNSTSYEDFYVYYNKTYPENGSGYSMVKSTVRWLTLEEVMEKYEQNPKKIFIDINLNIRNSCTIMIMQTYNNPVISNILNTEFYPVRLNSQHNDTIQAFGYKFSNLQESHGFHQASIWLLDGNMKFPAIVLFNEQRQKINTSQRFFTAEDLEPFLKYYSQDKYLNTSYSDFLKDFDGQLYKKQ